MVNRFCKKENSMYIWGCSTYTSLAVSFPRIVNKITCEDTEVEAHKYFSRKSFENFTGKTPVLESLFKKVAGPQACDFIKKRLQHRCFPVNVREFFKAPFLIEHLRWPLFKISKSNNPTICPKIFHQYYLSTRNIWSPPFLTMSNYFENTFTY